MRLQKRACDLSHIDFASAHAIDEVIFSYLNRFLPDSLFLDVINLKMVIYWENDQNVEENLNFYNHQINLARGMGEYVVTEISEKFHQKVR